MKKYLAFVLFSVMLITSTLTVYAGTIENNEWYELIEEEISVPENQEVEVTPYTKYLMNVLTTIDKRPSNGVGIRSDVYCSEAMQTIRIDFRLEKKSGSSWVTVGTATAYDANVASTAKSVTASGLAAGTYRASTSALVIDKYGYSESLTSTSGSITIK